MDKQSHYIKSFGANLKNRRKHSQSANMASSGASLVRLHIGESRLSLHQCTKTTNSMPIDLIVFPISIYFTFDDPSVTMQFMALPCNWHFNSWFD